MNPNLVIYCGDHKIHESNKIIHYNMNMKNADITISTRRSMPTIVSPT